MIFPKASPHERFKSIALGICDTAEPNCVDLGMFTRQLNSTNWSFYQKWGVASEYSTEFGSFESDNYSIPAAIVRSIDMTCSVPSIVLCGARIAACNCGAAVNVWRKLTSKLAKPA